MLRSGALIVLITLLLFLSCAKKGDITDTRVMMTGKWNVSSMLEKENTYNPPRVNNYTGHVNDFAEFGRDGTVHTFINGTERTMKYSILSNEWILMGNDSFHIVQLVPDRFTIARNIPAVLYEYTLNLTK